MRTTFEVRGWLVGLCKQAWIPGFFFSVVLLIDWLEYHMFGRALLRGWRELRLFFSFIVVSFCMCFADSLLYELRGRSASVVTALRKYRGVADDAFLLVCFVPHELALLM